VEGTVGAVYERSECKPDRAQPSKYDRARFPSLEKLRGQSPERSGPELGSLRDKPEPIPGKLNNESGVVLLPGFPALAFLHPQRRSMQIQ
jgi:hypothetical protein